MSRRAGIVAPCRHGLALVVATAGLACTADDDSTPDCVATFVIEADAGPPGMPALGGISDLCVAPTGGGAFRLWAVTDRGPNGQVPTSAGTRRSLLAPDFSPCLLELDAGPVREACRAAPAAPARLAIETFLPLRTRSGRPASGRPTGAGRDPPLVDHASREPLAPDPDGIDSEAVAVLADGSFWLAEEYGPALVHVAADGRMLARLVPAGSAAAGADAIVEPVLPAAYAGRRDNRGFEALAVLAGEGRLAVLLQSPLAPDDDSGRRAGNVPLLVIDAATRRPVAEHLYRAGDPRQPRHATHGNAPADVKLCAMTPAGPGTLLVLEQGDDGSAVLYAAEPGGATDTLPRRDAGGGRRGDPPVVEHVFDLAAAAVVPVAKRLVADLGPLLPRFRADAGLGADAPLKLEGLALLDERHVALVNDDDFGIHARGAERPRSCLWVVRLARPVARPTAASVRP